MGAYQQALELYKKVHEKAPDNLECAYLNILMLPNLVFLISIFRFAVFGEYLQRFGIKGRYARVFVEATKSAEKRRKLSHDGL